MCILCVGKDRHSQLRILVTPYLTIDSSKMAADQASLALDQSRVGSEDYLTSLTRRLDVLEKKLVGDSGIKEDQPPLKTTVDVSSASGLFPSSYVRDYIILNIKQSSLCALQFPIILPPFQIKCKDISPVEESVRPIVWGGGHV